MYAYELSKSHVVAWESWRDHQAAHEAQTAHEMLRDDLLHEFARTMDRMTRVIMAQKYPRVAAGVRAIHHATAYTPGNVSIVRLYERVARIERAALVEAAAMAARELRG